MTSKDYTYCYSVKALAKDSLGDFYSQQIPYLAVYPSTWETLKYPFCVSLCQTKTNRAAGTTTITSIHRVFQAGIQIINSGSVAIRPYVLLYDCMSGFCLYHLAIFNPNKQHCNISDDNKSLVFKSQTFMCLELKKAFDVYQKLCILALGKLNNYYLYPSPTNESSQL